MNYIIVSIATLVGYSLVSTILYLIMKEDDDVVIFFGLGIIGNLLLSICWAIRKVLKWKKYHNKRSIIEIKSTGERRYCKLKDTNDIHGWFKGYELVKRYATKDEWKALQPFSKRDIDEFKKNCDNCIHDEKECWEDIRRLCDLNLDYFDKFEAK